ncbi:hypothetical protein At1g04090-like [Rutidosis leptorrhynchoides]|uniref:hypothetical protein At1g04090-like n=1 Tax=Rutidosis leptorrhynchoides TaxID=125765 RepID=UPI003A9A38F7
MDLERSSQWFFENGALLYYVGDESNPIRVEKDGANLPQGGLNDKTYWLDLPVNSLSKERVKSGNLQNARAYFHVKPVSVGLYADISIWVFHPFNGASRAKVLFRVVSLAPVGEHGLEWDANSKIVAYSALHGHGLYPRSGTVCFGLKGAKGAKVAGLLDITSPSNKVMDTCVGAVVVAAEYLGGVVVEPPWLNYMRNWGPRKSYVIDEELHAIRHRLGWYLSGVFERFFQSLLKIIFSEGGPTGPKVKGSWNGSEKLHMVIERPISL